MTDEEKDKLRVIVCRPNEYAETVEIEDDLHAMQELVGGGLISGFSPLMVQESKLPSEQCISSGGCESIALYALNSAV